MSNKKHENSTETKNTIIAGSIVGLILIIIITICLNGGAMNNANSNMDDNISNSETSNIGKEPPLDTQVELNKEEVEQLRKMLEENGVDPSIIEEATKTENGGVLLGSAKPVKQFKTLADAEEYYDDYFGFHNTIESLPDYSLVGMYAVYDQFLQGIYETSDEKHVVTVKFSKTLSSDELREVYNDYKFVEVVSYNEEIRFACEGNKSDEINLVRFDFPNGKAYTVYSVEPFSKDTAYNIAFELIENLMSMDDWVDEWKK